MPLRSTAWPAVIVSTLVTCLVLLACTRKQENTAGQTGTTTTTTTTTTTESLTVSRETTRVGTSTELPPVEGEEHHGEADTRPIPTTLAAIWGEVQQEQAALEQAITAGELDEIHIIAFRIRDLVAAMPPLTDPSIPRASLDTGIQRVAQIAALLDQYGDAKDAVHTREQKTRLDEALSYIQSLYPAGALGTTQ